MWHRLSALLCIVMWSPLPSAGQSPAAKIAAANTTTGARTAWGEPDLQGIWDFAIITPLERPDELAGKATLTDQEAKEYERKTLERRNPDRRDGGADADIGRAYNQFWWDYGTKVVNTRRTALITDPPDGKVPALLPEAKTRIAARAGVLQGLASGPEDRSLAERCILGMNAGPPMVPGPYNNNVQVFQTPGYVVLLNEMVNDARIIPLDGRPHLPASIQLWRGDSRGRWEGKTLVVDTTNFRNPTNFRGSTSSLHLIERFTRVSPDTLLYEFTVEDPKTWTRPWSAAIPMSKSEGPIYEYACHEGNYGMFNLLSGARTLEKQTK